MPGTGQAAVDGEIIDNAFKREKGKCLSEHGAHREPVVTVVVVHVGIARIEVQVASVPGITLVE